MVATVPRSGDQERLDRLAELLTSIRPGNAFQQARLGDAAVAGWDDLGRLPLTTKDELLADQAAHPPFGTNLTFGLERYTHLHQTSGTTGATLRVLDTAEDWDWWRRQLARVLTAAGIGPGDRVALAHSFGPYVQFWASYEGAQEAGALVIPLGGMDSTQRLQTIAEYGATALLCTPSYALHIAKLAAEKGMTGALETVERVVCTGEPGASLPAVRDRIERAWDARCLDHAGASEVGSFAYPCATDGGIHLFEDEFICEVLDPASGAPVEEGEAGELVMTALGRVGFPVVRFRTGDMVQRSARRCSAGHAGLWLPRGILGRTDDMVVIRGMNVFPSAIEEILRQSSGVGEFSITFYNDPHAMDEVKVEVELAQPREARDIQDRLRHRLGLRVRIVPVKPGILPTYVGKARRVRDLRPSEVTGGRS
jgi:phenylacetate-CoA ligase